MNKNRDVLKILISFIACSVCVSLVLLLVNAVGFIFLAADFSNTAAPTRALREIEESNYTLPDEYYTGNDIWCILIGDGGDVIFSKNVPSDVPMHYSINDVANMTRWFLNDYPVYVRTTDVGLLVIGYPKDSVGKFPVEFSMGWFEKIPTKIIGIFLANVFLASLLAVIICAALLRALRRIINGIKDLRQQRNVHLKTSGIFSNVSANINETSEILSRKNLSLKKRDEARLNWISGISHDIRTPLSIILGHSEAIGSGELTKEETSERAAKISVQAVKIKQLIADLNLISSLEYDMQPSKLSEIKICALLRRCAADILSEANNEKFEIEVDLHDENAVISGDKRLLQRAFSNLLLNSVKHNPDGCKMKIAQFVNWENKCEIMIADNGSGAPQDVLDNIQKIPKTSHGLGLPMAYRIIKAHGGRFTAYNRGGFCVRITLGD